MQTEAAQDTARGRKFTVDCTPSWRTQAEWCLVGLEDGSERAKQVAREEIRRMGSLIDALLAEREAA